MKLYVTFGVGQYGRALANHYLEFDDASETSVREFMRDEFGGKWCGLYTEEEFKHQPREYALTRLVKFDNEFNVITRGRNADLDPL